MRAVEASYAGVAWWTVGGVWPESELFSEWQKDSARLANPDMKLRVRYSNGQTCVFRRRKPAKQGEAG